LIQSIAAIVPAYRWPERPPDTLVIRTVSSPGIPPNRVFQEPLPSPADENFLITDKISEFYESNQQLTSTRDTSSISAMFF